MSDTTTEEEEEVHPMRYSQGDLAILSAEVYDPGFPYNASTKAQGAKKTRAAASDTDSGPRKRAKVQAAGTEEGEEAEKKRSRGRPRLDVKDVSPKDRRRTQVRLAQRAYRNRKEEAIQSLEKQVQELKDKNQEMNNAFLRLHDFATSMGFLDQLPELGHQLHVTTERFASLAKNTVDDDGKEGQHASSASDDSSSRQRSQSTQADARFASATVYETSKAPAQLYGGLMISHEPATHPPNLVPNLSNEFSQPMPVSTQALGYEIVTYPTLNNASFPFQATPDLNFVDQFTTTGLHSSLPAPRSYAPHEITFGRRLQRFAIEKALFLISMPDPPENRITRIFGFCLLFETPDSIKRRLARQLARNAQDTLHNWQFPFYHLGGAGTHYDVTTGVTSQRIGNQGTADVLKPANTSGFATGPFSPEVNRIRDSSLDENMHIETPGFGGDLLDPDEVEIYLQERGVIIPPGTDFVTAEVDPTTFDTTEALSHPFKSAPGAPDFASFASPLTAGRTPRSPMPSTGSSSTLVDYSSQSQEMPWLNNVTGVANSTVDTTFSGSFSQAGLYTMAAPSTSSPDAELRRIFAVPEVLENTGGFGEGLQHQPRPPVPAPPRQRVTIDVHQFIKVMVSNGICLGRAPGFRQEHINAAFWLAAQSQ
ncbi:hypothetical protein QBC40DRAFT_4437 [Triangularia verruculosa]|uniref:BZIP domain-containing protein n=1 Tax=Triangularia verruculosa TaxID=2587418 RepID=A0AAN6XAA0_9PEZI|nr:hypothetical protein QBC40DRAFT_4437 [Triangularia verruculosa]